MNFSDIILCVIYYFNVHIFPAQLFSLCMFSQFFSLPIPSNVQQFYIPIWAISIIVIPTVHVFLYTLIQIHCDFIGCLASSNIYVLIFSKIKDIKFNFNKQRVFRAHFRCDLNKLQERPIELREFKFIFVNSNKNIFYLLILP